MATATQSLGIDAERLSLLPAAIRSDIAAEMYDGAVVLVARRGEVILHEAIGYADRAAGRPVQLDSVFVTMSMFKPMTSVAVLQCIDRGQIAFTTQVREVIPEYAANGKSNTTIADLLLHKARVAFGCASSARGNRRHSGDHRRCLQHGPAIGSGNHHQLFGDPRT